MKSETSTLFFEEKNRTFKKQQEEIIALLECPICRGRGQVDGCPSCGKLPQDNPLLVRIQKRNEKAKYDAKVWNKNILLNTHESLAHDRAFVQYVEFLDKYITYAKNGKFSNKSYLIISDSGSGKHAFVDNLFSLALSFGKTVCSRVQKGADGSFERIPVIVDHKEYLRLMRADYYRNNLPINIEEIVYSDIFVMAVDPGDTYSAMTAIASVLNKRGNLGLPSLIISNYSMNNLVNNKNKHIEVRFDEECRNNKQRYVTVVKSF